MLMGIVIIGNILMGGALTSECGKYHQFMAVYVIIIDSMGYVLLCHMTKDILGM